MKPFSLMIMGVLLFSLQCNSPKPVESRSAAQEMTLKNQIQNGAFLVDVRTPEEFEAGSYPGAVNIPLDQVESRAAEFKGKPAVVVFCRSGKRSAEAIQILEKNGIQKVSNGISTQNLEKEMQ